MLQDFLRPSGINTQRISPFAMLTSPAVRDTAHTITLPAAFCMKAAGHVKSQRSFIFPAIFQPRAYGKGRKGWSDFQHELPKKSGKTAEWELWLPLPWLQHI